MPQLDLLIFKSQSIFIILFLLGYFIFLKNILSVISFELKYKVKLELFYLKWFNKVLNKVAQLDSNSLSLLIYLLNLTNFVQYIINPQSFIFGVYSSDLLILKIKFLNKI